MTSAHPDNLTSVVFRALYPEYTLIRLGVLHIVTPKGTPVFIGDSLGDIARQISDRHPGQAGMPSPAPRPGPAGPA